MVSFFRVLAPLFLALAFFAPPLRGQVCKRQAAAAVAQVGLAEDLGCDVDDFLWSPDGRRHFAICQDQPKNAWNFFRERNEGLDRCLRRHCVDTCSPSQVAFCQRHGCDAVATKAVQQQIDNLVLGCSFEGPRWSSNFYDHHQRCLDCGNPSGSWCEWSSRRSKIGQCAICRMVETFGTVAPLVQRLLCPDVGLTEPAGGWFADCMKRPASEAAQLIPEVVYPCLRDITQPVEQAEVHETCCLDHSCAPAPCLTDSTLTNPCETTCRTIDQGTASETRARAFWHDEDQDGQVSTGDTIVIEHIQSLPDLHLGWISPTVPGDSFGDGAALVGTNADAGVFTILLGTTPKLRIPGHFDPYFLSGLAPEATPESLPSGLWLLGKSVDIEPDTAVDVLSYAESFLPYGRTWEINDGDSHPISQQEIDALASRTELDTWREAFRPGDEWATIAIQAAMDRAASIGARVLVPAGRYRIGRTVTKRFVTENGATHDKEVNGALLPHPGMTIEGRTGAVLVGVTDIASDIDVGFDGPAYNWISPGMSEIRASHSLSANYVDAVWRSLAFENLGFSITSNDSHNHRRLAFIDLEFSEMKTLYSNSIHSMYLDKLSSGQTTDAWEDYGDSRVVKIARATDVLIDRIRIRRESFPDEVGTGLLLFRSHDVLVKDCNIEGYMITGINIQGSEPGLDPMQRSKNVTVDGCRIRRYGLGDVCPKRSEYFEDHGIYAWGHDGLRIVDNHVSGWSLSDHGYALKVRNGENMLIADNCLEDSGILLYTYGPTAKQGAGQDLNYPRYFRRAVIRGNTISQPRLTPTGDGCWDANGGICYWSDIRFDSQDKNSCLVWDPRATEWDTTGHFPHDPDGGACVGEALNCQDENDQLLAPETSCPELNDFIEEDIFIEDNVICGSIRIFGCHWPNFTVRNNLTKDPTGTIFGCP